jgi:hypothetical protein
MTYPSFASGDVLAATDMNAVGLWLIKTQTIGSAVSSVNVTGAFSSTYDDYLIHVSNTVVSANQPALGIRLGATTTNYGQSGLYISFASTSITGNVTTVGTSFSIGECGNGTTGQGRLSMGVTVKNPNIAQATFFSATNGSLAWSSMYNGFLNNTTQYTDFTILPTSGTLTGGTIRVYGYKNGLS